LNPAPDVGNAANLSESRRHAQCAFLFRPPSTKIHQPPQRQRPRTRT